MWMNMETHYPINPSFDNAKTRFVRSLRGMQIRHQPRQAFDSRSVSHYLRGMRFLCLAVLLLGPFVPLACGDVLFIGSSQSFNEREEGEVAKRLDPAATAKVLEGLINHGKQDAAKRTVVFEEVFRRATSPVALGGGGREISTEFHCHSLAQYLYWPDGRDERMKRLKGEAGKTWSVVVLLGDPYLIQHIPGIYAEGVHLLSRHVRKGDAKMVLLMPWGENEAQTKVIREVVHRVAQGLNLPVAPAGQVWLAKRPASKEDAAFLAAASIYSCVSSRLAPGQEALAAQVLATVEKNRTLKPFTKPYAAPHPHALYRVDKPRLTFHQTGTSSEAGIRGGLQVAAKICGIELAQEKPGGTPIDFNYGRANSNFEAGKRYKVAPETYDRAYGFPMQEHQKSAGLSMAYGIDKRYFFKGKSYDDGTDLGIAYDMIRSDELSKDIRAVPVRLLLAKLRELDPGISPLRDRWHMSRELDAAIGSYMITAITGKNPASDPAPAKESSAWKNWSARRIGYETALRMGQLRFTPENLGK